MKITREQYAQLRNLCKKFNVSPEAIHLKKVVTIDKKHIRRRVVLTNMLKWNQTRLVMSVSPMKVRRIDVFKKYLTKKRASNPKRSWKKCVRTIRRKQFQEIYLNELNLENEIDDATEKEEQEVRDQLKTQLQLLQSRRQRSFCCDENSDDETVKELAKSELDISATVDENEVPNSSSTESADFKPTISYNSYVNSSFCLPDSDDEMPALRVTPIPEEMEFGPTCVTPDLEFEDDENKTKTSSKIIPKENKDQVVETKVEQHEDKKQLGFLDSLLKKIKSEAPTTPSKPFLNNAGSKLKVSSKKAGMKIIPSSIELTTTLEPMVTLPAPAGRPKRGKPKRHQTEVIKSEPHDLSVDSLISGICNSPFEANDKFLGFDEAEVPGLLPTPRVNNSLTSAFIDREEAKELAIKVEASSPQVINTKEHEGLVCIGSKPPILAKPKKLIDVHKPRTVAEKRQLMKKRKGLKFLMMENEARIYCELAKIKNNDEDYLLTCGSKEINFQMLNSLQHEQVPFRRDAWRALSWLKTEKNRFYYKVVYVDGVKCNLLGSKGNFDGKKKFRINQSPLPKFLESNRSPCCKRIRFPKSWKINLDVPAEPEPELTSPIRKLLDFDKQLKNIKPAPLSVKLKMHNALLNEDDCLGPLELCRMPPIELEVYPKEGRPIDSKVLPYLKALLPHENITEKWARFAVSLLKHHAQKTVNDPIFSFEMPYQNNRDKFFIRRRIKHVKPDSLIHFETSELDQELSFVKTIDKDDQLGQEIGQILTDMTNCIAIGLAEDSFIQGDPDIDYKNLDIPLEPAPTVTKPVKEITMSRKIVRELKRLNATFITTESSPEKCSKAHCKKGCVCDSLATTLTFKNHCKKQECMLGCTCSNNQIYINNDEIKECNLTSDAVKSLREKATARLARVEKDFTPTLLLSNNSTYLIPGSDREHTRRSKRAPKKFDDYVNCEGDMPKIIPERRPPIRIKDPFEAMLHQIRHVSVTLRPLTHISSIEPWCMVHKLYKCFCKGEATEGKTFSFEDLDQVEERIDFGPSKRRMYVFEKEEPEKKRKRFSLDTSANKSNQSISNRTPNNNLSNDETTPVRSLRRNISFESISQDSSTSRSLIIDTENENGDDKVARRVLPLDDSYLTRRSPKTTIKMIESIKSYEERHPERLELLEKRLYDCEIYCIKEAQQNISEPKITPHLPSRRESMNSSSIKPVHQAKVLPKISTDPISPKVSLIEKPVEVKPAKKSPEIPVDTSMEKKIPDIPLIKKPIRLNITNSDEEVLAIALLKQIINQDNVLIATGKNKIFAKKELLYTGKLDFLKVMKKTHHQIFVIEKTPADIANNPDFLRANPMVRPAKDCNINQVINILMAPDSEEVTLLINEYNQWSIQLDESNKTDKIQPLKQVNTMLTRAMQYICNLQRENTEKLCAPMQAKLYFYRWSCMLQGFQQELLNVWQIKMKDGKEAVIITLKDGQPEIDDLVSFVNIKDLTATSPSLTLFSKMLLLKVNSDETKGLSLVLYGGTTFWRVCGFINSDINYYEKGVVARPTPDTHPQLSQKINLFFNIMKKSPVPAPSQKTVNEPEDSSKAEPKPQYKTNIQMYSADVCALKSLFLPIPSFGEHRWFMLHLSPDFSDIFIPAWNSYLTYDKIAFALKLAENHKKTVRVTINEKFPEIYATPEHSDRIFFGPYRMNQEIDYILCQNFDGELITREEYQKRLKFRPRNLTRGSWLYLKRVHAAENDGKEKQLENSTVDQPEIVNKTNNLPPPFVISSVQTVTDPKFVPSDDSDDDVQEVPQCDDIIDLDDESNDEAPPPVDAVMEWKERDSIDLLSSGSNSANVSNDELNETTTTTSTVQEVLPKGKRRISDTTDIESHFLKKVKQTAAVASSTKPDRRSIATEKFEKPEKPIKLTICKPKEGDSYVVKSNTVQEPATKSGESSSKPITPVGKTQSDPVAPSTITKLPPTSSSFDLTGKRISIPLNMLKSMKKTVTMPPDFLQKLIQPKESSGTGQIIKSPATITIPKAAVLRQKVKPVITTTNSTNSSPALQSRSSTKPDGSKISLKGSTEKLNDTSAKPIPSPIRRIIPLSISVTPIPKNSSAAATTPAQPSSSQKYVKIAPKPTITKLADKTKSLSPIKKPITSKNQLIRIRHVSTGETSTIVPVKTYENRAKSPKLEASEVTKTEPRRILLKKTTKLISPLPQPRPPSSTVVIKKTFTPQQNIKKQISANTVLTKSSGQALGNVALLNKTVALRPGSNLIKNAPPNAFIKSTSATTGATTTEPVKPPQLKKTTPAITMPGTSKIISNSVIKIEPTASETLETKIVSGTSNSSNLPQPSTSNSKKPGLLSSKIKAVTKANVNPNLAFIGTTFTTQEGQDVPEVMSDEGYFISGVPVLGKIKAKKTDKGFLLPMPDSSDGVKFFSSGHEAALNLNKFLKQFIYALLPENFLIQWKFETNPLTYQKYPDFKPLSIPKRFVVTRFGGFNLNQDWVAFNYLEKIDKSIHLKVLCLKLMDMCFPNASILKTDALSVLQIARETCEALTRKSKMAVLDKIQLKEKNDELIKKLDQLHGSTTEHLPPINTYEVSIVQKSTVRRKSQGSQNMSPRPSTSGLDPDSVSLIKLPKGRKSSPETFINLTDEPLDQPKLRKRKTSNDDPSEEERPRKRSNSERLEKL